MTFSSIPFVPNKSVISSLVSPKSNNITLKFLGFVKLFVNSTFSNDPGVPSGDAIINNLFPDLVFVI